MAAVSFHHGDTEARGIDARQIKRIHALKNAIGMGDADYRDMVQEVHGFSTTSKDLSYEDAEELIGRLEAIAVPMGVWASPREHGGTEKYLKYENLGHRQGMASPKQLRMIEAMWAGVSYAHNRAGREKALRGFLKRIAGVEDLKFLEGRAVQKVVRAIEAMKGDPF